MSSDKRATTGGRGGTGSEDAPRGKGRPSTVGRLQTLCCWGTVISFALCIKGAEVFELSRGRPWFLPVLIPSLLAIYRWEFRALIPLLALFYATVDDALIWQVPENASLEGKIIAITGANSGIGLESAKQLSALGAKIILACRSVGPCEEAAHMVPNSVVGPPFDLGDPRTSQPFADWIMTKYKRLDILVNNAGFMTGPAGRAFPGKLGDVEPFLGYMHLGHFSLTRALVPALKSGHNPLVINLSSKFADMPFFFGYDCGFQDLEPANPVLPYTPSVPFFEVVAYTRAKQANVLFTNEIPKRYGIASKAFLPSFVVTNLATFYGIPYANYLFRQVGPGVRGLLRAALRDVEDYPGDCINSMTDPTNCFAEFSPLLLGSYNVTKAAEKLWEWSEANV